MSVVVKKKKNQLGMCVCQIHYITYLQLSFRDQNSGCTVLGFIYLGKRSPTELHKPSIIL